LLRGIDDMEHGVVMTRIVDSDQKAPKTKKSKGGASSGAGASEMAEEAASV
jgi:hypothetical protein